MEEKPTTYEKLKSFYDLIKRECKNHEDFVDITKVFLWLYYSKNCETPQISIGYQVQEWNDEKESFLWVETKNDWERTLFGKVIEKGCSGGGGYGISLESSLENKNEEEILADNVERIAQSIYDQMYENDPGTPVKYQLHNGGKAPNLESLTEEMKPVMYKDLTPLPKSSFSKLEKQLKKLVKSKAKRSWEK